MGWETKEAAGTIRITAAAIAIAAAALVTVVATTAAAAATSTTLEVISWFYGSFIRCCSKHCQITKLLTNLNWILVETNE